MKYIDRIKKLFFTEKDLGIHYPDEHNEMLARENKIISDGAKSSVLMSNPIFQDAVSEIYLSLEAQLDMVEDTQPDSDKMLQSIRHQRRALRQICALLDNKIAAMEQVQKNISEATIIE